MRGGTRLTLGLGSRYDGGRSGLETSPLGCLQILLPISRHIHNLEQKLLNASFGGHNLTLQTNSIQSLVFKLSCDFPGLSLSSTTLTNVSQVRGSQGSPAGPCPCSVPVSWDQPHLLSCGKIRKRKCSVTSPGQGHHLDFCLEVEGRSRGLVAARVTCVLLGPWCKTGWDAWPVLGCALEWLCS